MMKDSSLPRVSVVTITRNDLTGLRQTCASIDAQIFRDFEWIIVDGGSTDGTFEYLRSIDNSNCTWLSEPDKGIYDAMNKGLDRANGRYVIFMNSGDGFAGIDVLSRLAVVSQDREDWDLVFGDAYEESSDGRLFLKRSRSAGAINYGMFTHHQAMLYSRKAIGDMRYDLGFRVAADYDFTSRLLARGGSSFRVGFPVCICKRAGFSVQNADIGRRENLSIQKNVLLLGPLRRASNYALFVTSNLMRTHLRSLYDKVRFAQHAPAA